MGQKSRAGPTGRISLLRRRGRETSYLEMMVEGEQEDGGVKDTLPSFYNLEHRGSGLSEPSNWDPRTEPENGWVDAKVGDRRKINGRINLGDGYK